MILRAPWLFATAPSYRGALFKGMLRGEVLVRSGVHRFVRRPEEGKRPLRLILRPNTPAVTILVSTVAFDAGESREAGQVCALLRACLEQGFAVRLVAVEETIFPHEARVRAWLQARGVVQPVHQARLEMIDGTLPLFCLGQGDAFIVAAVPAWAPLLRQRLDGRSARAVVHVLNAEHAELAGGLQALALPPDPTPQDALTALAPVLADLAPAPPQPFAHQSRLGLGYQILKPLAGAHTPGRTCLFVHFDPDGRIDPHVLRYLSALKGCGLDTILISSGALKAEALAVADPLVAAILTRQNKGLDFSGWALALELFPQLRQSESLLIANDSVYGPVGDLKALFERMEREPHDVWGLVESRDIDRHFQSWFVNFRRPALQSEAFAAFWSEVLPLDDKRAVIRQYEVPIWRTLETAGLRVGAAVPWEGHEAASNPTMEGWRVLLDLGAPFVKVQLLRDNPTAADLDGWAAELQERGYPAELVADHLHRVKGAEAAAFGTA